MQQGLNRRRFLGAAMGTGAAAATGVLAPSALGNGRKAHAAAGSGKVPRNRRGIQLYTMRRIMEKSQADASSVLRWLGRNGYTEVETAGHYGWTPAQFRRELDRAGLKAISGHDGPDFTFPAGWQDSYEETLAYAKALGQKFTGLAWQNLPTTEESYRKLAAGLDEAGKLARKYDLQFFYHNHDFEFLNKQANGDPLYDILLEETDRRYVKFELDLFWITEGGANGVEYLSADPTRYIGYHVKDHVWGDRPNANDYEDAGPGMLDFPDLFEAGDEGDKHFFVEHDEPWLSHTDDDANAEYLTAGNGIRYLEQVRW